MGNAWHHITPLRIASPVHPITSNVLSRRHIMLRCILLPPQKHLFASFHLDLYDHVTVGEIAAINFHRLLSTRLSFPHISPFPVPEQSLHYNFLSQIKPAYLLRTRAYSRTISKKPFLVNYQGAQFRVYPGEYQCLLDVGSRYKRVRFAGCNEAIIGGERECLSLWYLTRNESILTFPGDEKVNKSYVQCKFSERINDLLFEVRSP